MKGLGVERYETKTLGTREQPAARIAGEGERAGNSSNHQERSSSVCESVKACAAAAVTNQWRSTGCEGTACGCDGTVWALPICTAVRNAMH
jgi:hypothetical protein